jgi:hypothetical protein
MNRAAQCLVVFALFGLGGPLGSQTTQHPKLRRHWSETETETLWRERYTNCDYGFYVLLGDGVIGHDTLPPSPNHGFVVSLSDVGGMKSVSGDEARLVWVDAHYDETEEESDPDKGNSTRLAGLPATISTAESPSPSGIVVDEGIRAVRSGIVYTVSLHTTQKDRVADEKEFRRIVNGFKLLRLPKGACSNG